MPKQTPRLNLYKVDPKTDGQQTFDIEKMLNENWDKIDQNVQNQTNLITQVAKIEKEFERGNAQRWEVKEGVQILESSAPSTLQFSTYRGRTFLNLSSPAGQFSSTSAWTSTSVGTITKVVESFAKEGPNALEITVGAGQTTAGISRDFSDVLQLDKRYLVALQTSATTGRVRVEMFGAQAETTSDFIWLKGKYASGGGTLRIYLDQAAATNTFLVEALRIYELSEEDFIRLDTQTRTEIETAFPYVKTLDGRHVPFIWVKGKNLVPPFIEWFPSTKEKWQASAQSLTMTGENESSWTSRIFAMPQTKYHISFSHISNGYFTVYGYDKRSKLTLKQTVQNQTSYTFTTPNQTYRIQIQVHASAAGATFKNLLLTLEEEETAYVTPTKNIGFMKTGCYSNQTGEVYDQLEGEYVRQWVGRVELDSTGIYTNVSTNGDLRTLGFVPARSMPPGSQYFGIGFQKPLLAGSDAVNRVTGYENGLRITVSNAHAGWGNAYTPTEEEIKAYFLGYRMMNAGETAYTGTGAKQWRNLATGMTTSVLPTNLNTKDGRDQYQIFYVLSSPRVVDAQKFSAQLRTGKNLVWVSTNLQFGETVASDSPSLGVEEVFECRMEGQERSVRFPTYPYQLDYAPINRPAFIEPVTLSSEKSLYTAQESLSQRVQSDITKLFTTVDSGKNKIKSAIIDKGGTVKGTAPHSFEELAQGIAVIKKGVGNAQPEDVLIGKEYSNANGAFTGTMPSWPSPTNAKSYQSSPGKVQVNIERGAYIAATPQVVINEPAFRPENIPEDTTVLGMKGTAQRPYATKSASPGTIYNTLPNATSFFYDDAYTLYGGRVFIDPYTKNKVVLAHKNSKSLGFNFVFLDKDLQKTMSVEMESHVKSPMCCIAFGVGESLYYPCPPYGNYKNGVFYQPNRSGTYTRLDQLNGEVLGVHFCTQLVRYVAFTTSGLVFHGEASPSLQGSLTSYLLLADSSFYVAMGRSLYFYNQNGQLLRSKTYSKSLYGMTTNYLENVIYAYYITTPGTVTNAYSIVKIDMTTLEILSETSGMPSTYVIPGSYLCSTRENRVLFVAGSYNSTNDIGRFTRAYHYEVKFGGSWRYIDHAMTHSSGGADMNYTYLQTALAYLGEMVPNENSFIWWIRSLNNIDFYNDYTLKPTYKILTNEAKSLV